MNKKVLPENHLNTNTPKSKKILVGVFIFLAFISGWYFGHLDKQVAIKGIVPQIINKENPSIKNVDFSLFWEAWDKIVEEFDGKIDTQQLLYGAIRGMVGSLGDPYTVFMDPEETKEFEQEISGSISGIGAEIGIKDNKLTIITPLENSPAQRAGIRSGDIILKIESEDTTNMSLGEAVAKIRGKEKTKVKLTISRDGIEKVYEITREKINIESLKYELKEKNIGYIEIVRFDEDTHTKLKNAINDLLFKGAKSFVIDLRNNPGGFLDSSINVAGEFIKDGVIVIEKKIDGSGEKRFKASEKGQLTDPRIPLIVLVNNGSASASEIVAGAIKDHKRGILIGEKTFGKGSVQEIENLGKNTSLRITVAHWFTPSGKNIDKEGLLPDIEVKMTDEDFNANRDPQLDKAIEYIKSNFKYLLD